jgi:hypothetical protein
VDDAYPGEYEDQISKAHGHSGVGNEVYYHLEKRQVQIIKQVIKSTLPPAFGEM